jgi:CBS domain-containing protein
MGTLGIIVVFGTVYLQNFGRLLCCHLVGTPFKSCTLHLTGSVPVYSNHINGSTSEILTAPVGCMVSIIPPICFFLFLTFAKKNGWSVEICDLFIYLFITSVIFGLYNIFPLYPQDGGKLFKIILSLASKDESWSHRFVCRFGAVFGLLILYAAILTMLSGMIPGGICILIVGVSSYRAVTKSVQRILLSDQIKGIVVSKVMKKISCTVAQNISLHKFLLEYVYRNNVDVYPVIDKNGGIVNLITARQVIEYPINSCQFVTVGEIESQAGSMLMIDQRCEILDAFTIMQQTGIKRFLVIDSLTSHKVLGVVTKSDVIVAFLKVMYGARLYT